MKLQNLKLDEYKTFLKDFIPLLSKVDGMIRIDLFLLENYIKSKNIKKILKDDYGYKLESDSFDFFDDDEFDDSFSDEKIELDEDELISFLNEYYTVNSHLIPKGETF